MSPVLEPARPAVILLVDDDAGNRQTLAWLFRDAGFDVLEAGTGQEALALAADKPDLVLLDVNLPDISGFEVCKRLRAHPATRYSAVIHLSGVHIDSQDRTQGLDDGADAYLLKPVEPRELFAHVRALLRVRAAEEASRRAAQKWRDTFDAIRDVVVLVDAQGRIRRCNRALSLLVHRDFDHLVGASFGDVLRTSLGLDQVPAPLKGGIVPPEGEKVQLHLRWFRVTADPFLDEANQFAGNVYILHDITSQVQLEEQLRQSQRLEAIGRLAGGVAHDFNNLLTAILGNSSLLLRMLPRQEAEHELVTTIERAAWRAAELTRQLLGFSRQTLLWLTQVDPGGALEQAAAMARPQIGPAIQLRVQRPRELWPVLADPAHLSGVLTHLCLNALDAMPRGGQLSLSAANVELTAKSELSHPEGRPGGFVRLSVQDSGAGVPADVRDKIFDPFFTTKPTGHGTGLGLAMVHGIVKQHQGWIECHAPAEGGTRFDIYLPRDTQPAQRDGAEMPSRPSFQVPPAGPRPEPPAERATVPSRLVLLADDNDVLRSLAASYLREGGFQVLTAGDGREAIEVYQREYPRIDLVILDHIMPEVTGRDLLRQMRHINPTVRALLASGSSPQWDTQELLSEDGEAEKVFGIVRKPYRERELLQAVHEALGAT